MQKYSALKARVEGLAGVELMVPEAASQQQLQAAHQPDYVERVLSGTLTPGEVREIGFPWSPDMVERSRRSVGATIEAARHACADKVAVNLAGGTHHALAARGSGFCVFNDVAVAIHVLRQERLALHPLVIDLDVHQGNGTASIFAADPLVFTLSLHGEKNFPFRKEASDLDVDLPDGTRDDDYLVALLRSLDAVLAMFTPDFIFYLAGADPHEGDRLGRLKLTHHVSSSAIRWFSSLQSGLTFRSSPPWLVVTAAWWTIPCWLICIPCNAHVDSHATRRARMAS